jgi:hypothetical protein
MPSEASLARLQQFFRQARIYLERPGVLAGLELDELTVRARQTALTDLQDVPMGQTLERLLKAIRHADTEQVRQLTGEVAHLARAHGIGPEAE